MMKKNMFLKALLTMSAVSFTSAQASLYTTTDDFAQFNGGAGTVNSLYYSDSSTVNGLGNPATPGGAGGVGSLQLTAPGGWTGWVSGSDSPGESGNQAFLSAIDPGAIAAYSAGSGYGPGTLVAYSGTMSFDLYTGNFTDWSWFGINFNYDGNWNPQWASTSSTFTGTDGRTWTHFEVPYTINAVDAGLTYFQMGIAENAGSIAGETFFVDNFWFCIRDDPGKIQSHQQIIGNEGKFLWAFVPVEKRFCHQRAIPQYLGSRVRVQVRLFPVAFARAHGAHVPKTARKSHPGHASIFGSEGFQRGAAILG